MSRALFQLKEWIVRLFKLTKQFFFLAGGICSARNFDVFHLYVLISNMSRVDFSIALQGTSSTTSGYLTLKHLVGEMRLISGTVHPHPREVPHLEHALGRLYTFMADMIRLVNTLY